MSGDYGLWPLVVLDTAVFAAFAVSFFHPRTRRDWRVMGGFGAFIAALFTEMYGFPLTIYLLSGPLGSRFPLLRADHAGGHLWNDLIGWSGDPHLSPFHLVSYVLIGAGFWVIAVAWRHLYAAARDQRVAVAGPYAWVRHPQYLGFLAVMVGFLVQWPTLPTLLMFPVLVLAYRRLARGEEREIAAAFGKEWAAYAAVTPAFLPHRPQAVRASAQPSAAALAPGARRSPAARGQTRRPQ